MAPVTPVHVTVTPVVSAPSDAAQLVGAGMFRHPVFDALAAELPPAVTVSTQ